jgi:Tfp pilus assembly protein PilN
MRPVNLIPPDERRGDSAPLRTGPLVYVLVGAMALLLLGIVAVALTGKQVSDREAKKASLQQELVKAKAQADTVKAFTDFATMQQTRASTVSSLAQSRFDWERVLHELALVIPSDVTLISVTGSVKPDVQVSSSGGASSSGSADLKSGIQGPSLEISGCAPTQDAVAGFVSALEEVDGVTRVGLGSSELPEQSSTAPAGEPPANSGSSGGSCPDPTFATFSIVVAFDNVPPPGTAAPVPPAPSTAAPTSNDPSGGVQSQNDAVKASLNKTSARAHNVIHAIGTGG